MKHYPIIVANEKAAACVETGWEWAVVSLKFSHRKGQKVSFTYCESDLVSNIWIDVYSDYTAIRFQTKQQYWEGAREAISYCASMVKDVIKSINMDAEDNRVSKELLIILV